MSVFKKNILYSYSSQAVSVLCNFLGSILIARMLGASGQGEYSLYMNLLSLSILIVGMGLSSGLVHFIASGKIEKSQVLSISLSITLLLTGLGLLIFFILKSLFNIQILLPSVFQDDGIWKWVLLFHILFHVFSSYFQAILHAEQRFKEAGTLTVLGSILLLSLYSIHYFQVLEIKLASLQWIIVSLVITLIIQLALYKLFIYKISSDYFKIQTISWPLAKPLILFSFTAFIANLVQFFNYKLDVWIIHYFHQDTSQLGVYTLAVSLSQLVWLLPGAVHGVLYSAVSTDKLNLELIEKTSKTAWYLLGYSVLASTAGYLLSISMVPAWFGESFADVPDIIRILCLGIIPVSAGLALSAFFAGIQKISINLQGSFIGLVLCIIFDFIFIPTMGIKGAAWATVISYNATILYYVIMFAQFKKRIQQSQP